MRLSAASILLILVSAPLPTLAAAQAVPQPFPKPNGPGRATQPAQPTQTPTTTTPPVRPAAGGQVPSGQAGAATAPAAGQADAQAPTEATLGAPIYPGAQFLASYNAGQGQRYYLFGSTASFVEVVGFYRTALRTRGEIVFEEPATHMFEIGRFREDTMAFPPSVTVKDYTWGTLGGYLNPKAGAQPARFPTIIQMVPAAAGTAAR